MSTLTALEAYDAIRFSEHFQERLSAAEAEMAPRRGLAAEKGWLATVQQRLAEAREGVAALVEQARELPELAEVRQEFGAVFQGQWVDALERLLAGITFHIGGRDPVIEALFPHQKFPALRRAAREALQGFAGELDRRRKSSYVTRILAQPEFAFAQPVFEQLDGAWARYQSAFGSGSGLDEARAAELRKELVAAGKRLDLATRQARLLAEAALLPVDDAFEALGLNAKPKKRAARAPAKDEVEPAPAAPAKAAAPEPAEPPAEKEASAKATPADKPENQAEDKPETGKAVRPAKRRKAAASAADPS